MKETIDQQNRRRDEPISKSLPSKSLSKICTERPNVCSFRARHPEDQILPAITTQSVQVRIPRNMVEPSSLRYCQIKSSISVSEALPSWNLPSNAQTHKPNIFKEYSTKAFLESEILDIKFYARCHQFFKIVKRWTELNSGIHFV